MPPKKTFSRDDSEDDSSVETSSSDEDVAPTRQNDAQSRQQGGRGVANKPHDEEFDAGNDDQMRTPPEDNLRRPAASTAVTVTPAAKKGSGTILRNNPNDETFDVEDDRPVQTPPRGGAAAGGGGAGRAPAPAAGGRSGTIQNNPHDYYEDAGDEGSETPPRQHVHAVQANKKPPATLSTNALGNRSLQNDTHDEAIDVSDNSQGTPASNYGSATPQSTHKQAPVSNKQTLPPQGKMSMQPEESSSEDEGEGDGEQGGPVRGVPNALFTAKGNKPPPTHEYNPADYASINQRASREMQELFMTIAQYQPQVQELPSKLRPFIPDYIPSVGDLDPFCQIPRPDGRPDNFGLTVVDEPCANQSNPAVVVLYLKYITRGSAPSVHVESVEDAANRPNVIDKWIKDIKDLQKPLPTVNYSKLMPEIESLLQAWSPEFEELLNSDLQFPPTQVDLDIDQYVRVMSAILDIPTYGSLVESVHVMFTLYCEFRANQHFQHA